MILTDAAKFAKHFLSSAQSNATIVLSQKSIAEPHPLKYAKIEHMKNTPNDPKLFEEELNKMLEDPKVQKLNDIPQHQGNNTLVHSVAVARASFELAQKLHWKVDEKELVRGALLHDYYLYDTETMTYSDYEHGITHPQTALDEASKHFELSDKEQNIIRSHMWPLTLFHPPKSKEAFLVSMADKLCAAKEIYLKKH